MRVWDYASTAHNWIKWRLRINSLSQE
jgi:hypothetical protein